MHYLKILPLFLENFIVSTGAFICQKRASATLATRQMNTVKSLSGTDK